MTFDTFTQWWHDKLIRSNDEFLKHTVSYFDLWFGSVSFPLWMATITVNLLQLKKHFEILVPKNNFKKWGPIVRYVSPKSCCWSFVKGVFTLALINAHMLRSLHRMLARPVPDNHPQIDGGVDCRTVPGELIHFDLGDHEVTLDAEDYARPTPFNMTVPQGDRDWRLMCRSLLLPVDMEEPMVPKVFIWGEPMLRRFFTVYDVSDILNTW